MKPAAIYNVRLQVLKGRYLLVQSNQAYEIDEVGLKIWECCDGEHNLDEITKALIEEYDVSFEKARNDCEEFISELSKLGLIQ